MEGVDNVKTWWYQEELRNEIGLTTNASFATIIRHYYHACAMSLTMHQNLVEYKIPTARTRMSRAGSIQRQLEETRQLFRWKIQLRAVFWSTTAHFQLMWNRWLRISCETEIKSLFKSDHPLWDGQRQDTLSQLPTFTRMEITDLPLHDVRRSMKWDTRTHKEPHQWPITFLLSESGIQSCPWREEDACILLKIWRACKTCCTGSEVTSKTLPWWRTQYYTMQS